MPGFPFYHERVSALNPEEIRLRAKEVLARHGLTLYATRDVAELYMSLGVTLRGRALLLEVGDENLGAQVIPEFPECVVTVPYRITVYTKGDKTFVATILPEAYRRILPIPPRLRKLTMHATRVFDRRIRGAVRELCKAK